MKKEYIQQLISRYFEGGTTLDEERQLYAYFRSGEVDAEWLSLRQMFLDMEQVQMPSAVAKKVPMRRMRHRWIAACAAVFVGLLVVGLAVKFQRENSCVAYVYGQKVTDKAVVMQEVRNTMDVVVDNSGHVDAELKSMFD